MDKFQNAFFLFKNILILKKMHTKLNIHSFQLFCSFFFKITPKGKSLFEYVNETIASWDHCEWWKGWTHKKQFWMETFSCKCKFYASATFICSLRLQLIWRSSFNSSRCFQLEISHCAFINNIKKFHLPLIIFAAK